MAAPSDERRRAGASPRRARSARRRLGHAERRERQQRRHDLHAVAREEEERDQRAPVDEHEAHQQAHRAGARRNPLTAPEQRQRRRPSRSRAAAGAAPSESRSSRYWSWLSEISKSFQKSTALRPKARGARRRVRPPCGRIASRNQKRGHLRRAERPAGAGLGRGPEVDLLEVRIGAHERHRAVGAVRIARVVAGVEVLAGLGGGEHPRAGDVVVPPRHREEHEQRAGREERHAGTRTRDRALGRPARSSNASTPSGTKSRKLARVSAAAASATPAAKRARRRRDRGASASAAAPSSIESEVLSTSPT